MIPNTNNTRKAASNCQICGGVTLPFFSHFDINEKPIKIYKCTHCGHGNYLETEKLSGLNDMYDQNYATTYIDSGQDHSLRIRQYRYDVNLLASMSLGESIKVIDIGCSSGEYLDAMPDSWYKSGYEVNKFLKSRLEKERPNYQIYDQLTEIEETFDLVTLRGVIEHIPDHTDLIQFLQKGLKINGLLYISATPNFNSICATLYKEKWSQIVFPEHCHQFTSVSLQILLSKANLVCKLIAMPYLNTPYENWSCDRVDFLKNLDSIKRNTKRINTSLKKHPFPGNMLSIIFERVA